MQEQSVLRVRALLAEASSAHHDFELGELEGSLDHDWPGWYARYLLAHGLDSLIEGNVSEIELSQLLGTCDEEFRRDQPPVEWQDYYARRIVATAHGGQNSPTS